MPDAANRTLPEFKLYNQLYVSTGRPDEWAFLQTLDRGRFTDNIPVRRAPAAVWDGMFDMLAFE